MARWIPFRNFREKEALLSVCRSRLGHASTLMSYSHSNPLGGSMISYPRQKLYSYCGFIGVEFTGYVRVHHTGVIRHLPQATGRTRST